MCVCVLMLVPDGSHAGLLRQRKSLKVNKDVLLNEKTALDLLIFTSKEEKRI